MIPCNFWSDANWVDWRRVSVLVNQAYKNGAINEYIYESSEKITLPLCFSLGCVIPTRLRHYVPDWILIMSNDLIIIIEHVFHDQTPISKFRFSTHISFSHKISTPFMKVIKPKATDKHRSFVLVNGSVKHIRFHRFFIPSLLLIMNLLNFLSTINMLVCLPPL